LSVNNRMTSFRG